MLAVARDLALRGGRLAKQFFGAVEPSFKDDRSVVTEADRRVEDFIVGEIRRRFPDHSVLAEEGTRSISDPAAPLWIIDPIDGTSAFSHCLPVWGVSVAFFQDLQAVAGAFYLPLLDDLYTATCDGPARLGDRVLQPLEAAPIHSESLLCVSSDFHLRARNRFPGKARALGSLAANFCYVARGSAVAAVNQEAHIWDIAVGRLVLERVGAKTCLFDGSALDTPAMLRTTRTGGFLLAAQPAVMPLIRSYIDLI